MDQYSCMHENKLKLKLLLECSRTNKIHTNNILTLPTLKDAHIYCKCNKLSGQFTGPILEKYIKIKYDMSKNSASQCNGDLHCNGTNIEVKVSLGGKDHNKFNYVQIRVNHQCDYIFTAYLIDYSNLEQLGELYIFRLNKENIKKMLLKYGDYAHGTIREHGKITMDNLNNTENKLEYAIRTKYGDACWSELLQFRVNEITI